MGERIKPASQFLKAEQKENTLKKLAVAVLLALTCSLYANAQYISEIKQSFTNQTALLSPSAILTAPIYDASYLVCVYLEQPGSSNSLSATLAWTDENGNAQSFGVSQVTGSAHGCVPIRNKANTAPTVSTTGTYQGAYSLFATGLGFWTTGSQKQGGLSEPFNRTFLSQTSNLSATVLAAPSTYDQYLVAVTIAVPWQGQCGQQDMTVSLNWADDMGAQAASLGFFCPGAGQASIVLPIRVKANTSVELSTSGVAQSYDLIASAVKFGTPTVGSGPLTPYLLNWLNYTSPGGPGVCSNVASLVPDGTVASYVVAGNAAQVPNSGSITIEPFGEVSSPDSGGGFTFILPWMNPSGAPSSSVLSAYANNIRIGNSDDGNPTCSPVPTYNQEFLAFSF